MAILIQVSRTNLPQARNLEVGDRVKVRLGPIGNYHISAFMEVTEVWDDQRFVLEDRIVYNRRRIRAWAGSITEAQRNILHQINDRHLATRIARGTFS